MFIFDPREAFRDSITEKGYNQAAIARKINITPAKLSASLNKKRELKPREIFDLCGVLGIDPRVFMRATAQ